MNVERRDIPTKDAHLAILLSGEEVWAIREGKALGDRLRLGVTTLPDAKIEVFPLSAIDPRDPLMVDLPEEERYGMDRLKKGLAVRPRVQLDSSGDVRIFIPAMSLTDVRIAGVVILRDQVEILKDGANRNQILDLLPKGGIVVHFGGSLKIIDIPSLFYRDPE